jgi:hypothetical protein
MLKRVFLLMCLLGCLGILFFPGCKETTDDASSYTLTVTLGEGVSGTPAAGSYSYAENDTVSYSYSAQTGYGNLAVTLDGIPLASSGNITMTGNHILNATADIDIRGKWAGAFNWSGGDTYLEVTFSGGIFSGTTSGLFDFKPGTGNGEYSISGNQIEFILRYPDDSSLSCTATITDVNNMNGNWEFRSPWGFNPDGTFSLQRKF